MIIIIYISFFSLIMYSYLYFIYNHKNIYEIDKNANVEDIKNLIFFEVSILKHGI